MYRGRQPGNNRAFRRAKSYSNLGFNSESEIRNGIQKEIDNANAGRPSTWSSKDDLINRNLRVNQRRGRKHKPNMRKYLKESGKELPEYYYSEKFKPKDRRPSYLGRRNG